MSSKDQIKQKFDAVKFDDYTKSGCNKDSYERISLHKISKADIGKKVKFFGYVTSCRAGKRFSFFDLTFQFKTVKCIVETTADINFQTTLYVYGEVVENKGKDDKDFEIQVDAFEVFQGLQAPSFPLNDTSSKDTLLEHGHLYLRTKARTLFLKAQSELLRALREFYYENEYTEATPPTLVQTQVEGGATLFSLDYYGEKAYLTQSSQLYLETVVPVVGKAFCVMPSYRAEKSRTSRHLSEFTHVEAELADITFDDLLKQIEALLRSSISTFYKRMMPFIKEVYPDFEPVKLDDKPFKRITYKDAIEFLKSKKHLKTDGTEYQQGDDIADASEKFLMETFGENQPVFLIRFPEDHKPFYVFKDAEGTQTCDLLFPGIGEIVGGSMRHTVHKDLVEGFEKEGIDSSPYYWYLDMARFGPSPHGGYGLGFERLLMCILKYKSVDQASLFPRKPSRCTP